MKKRLLFMLLALTTTCPSVSSTILASSAGSVEFAEFTSGDCFSAGEVFAEESATTSATSTTSGEEFLNESVDEVSEKEVFTENIAPAAAATDDGYFSQFPVTTIYEETPLLLSSIPCEVHNEGSRYFKFTAPRDGKYCFRFSVDREKVAQFEEWDAMDCLAALSCKLVYVTDKDHKYAGEPESLDMKQGQTLYFVTYGREPYITAWDEEISISIVDVNAHTHKYYFDHYEKSPTVFESGVALHKCYYCANSYTENVDKTEAILSFRESIVEATAGKSKYYHNFFTYKTEDSIKSITLKDPSIAKITVSHDIFNQHHCTVKGLKGGSTTATITLASGLKKELKVNVKYPASPNAKLSASTLSLKVKQSTTSLKVSGITKGDKVKSYSSSNKKIFTVDSKGKITAKAKGTAKLTVTLGSGKKLTATIKVQTGTVKTTKLTVNKKTVTLAKGKTFQIKATKAPVTSQEKITYSSNKKSVATVSSTGKIMAKKKGTAYITVKSGSKSVKIKVVVE